MFALGTGQNNTPSPGNVTRLLVALAATLLLGVPGAIAVTGALLVGAGRAWGLVARGAVAGVWRLVLLGLFVLLNCVETAVMSATHAWWLVVSIVVLAGPE